MKTISAIQSSILNYDNFSSYIVLYNFPIDFPNFSTPAL